MFTAPQTQNAANFLLLGILHDENFQEAAQIWSQDLI